MALIDTLLDLQIPNSIQLSPNSRQVIYSTTTPLANRAGDHDLCSIWLADTGYAGSARRLTPGTFNDHAPTWCPDGESIAFISDRVKPGEQWAIYMLPLKGEQEPYPVTPVENERSIEGFEFSPDGRYIAYLSADEKTAEQKSDETEKNDAKVWGKDWAYSRLRMVEVATKTVKTLASRSAHVTAFAWNDDGSEIVFLETKHTDIESPYLYGVKTCTANVSTHQVRELCTFARNFFSIRWAGDTIYAVGNADTSTTLGGNAVYSLDVTKDPPTWTRCAHGHDDCPREVGKADRDITVRVEHGLEDQIRMLDGPVIFSGTKAILVWDAAFTTDSDEMIVAVAQGDVNNSPEVFTVTASGGRMVQLSDHGHPLKGQQLGRPQFLQCTSADGTVELDALWLTPATHPSDPSGPPTKPLPTFVFVHGGPYTRVTNSFNISYDLWDPVLLAAGYALLCPNYRGSSGRGEAFAADANGGRGTRDYDDVIALTNHAVEKGYADPARLMIGGWSQGGFMSYLAAVRNGLHGHGWKFRATIPGAGVSDWDTMVMTSDAGAGMEADLAGKAPWGCEKGEISNRGGSALWEFKGAVEKGNVIPPVLMLHGEEDVRVPVEQAVAFRRALESVGLPFEMVVYPREGHFFKERRHMADMAQRVVKFVQEQLGKE